MSPLGIVLAVLGLLVVLAVAVTITFWNHRHEWAARIAHERQTGNKVVRNRMKVGLGKRYTHITHVMRAETMPGWVWINMLREPPDPSDESIGWALTKHGAERGLKRHLARRLRYQSFSTGR